MPSHRFPTRFDRLIALWILRAFSPALGRSAFISNSDFADPDIAEFLGLPRHLDKETIFEIPRVLDELHNSLELFSPPSLPAKPRANFTRFAAALKLSSTEQRILEFFACMKIEPPLADTGNVIRKAFDKEPPRFLARILDVPRHEAAKALTSGSRLMECGLLKRSQHPHKFASLEFHSEALAVRLLRDSYDPGKLLKLFGVITPSPPELGLGDYPHLQTSLDLLLPYLRTVRNKRKRGVNVLVHGAPGTGKSQLVRVLGKALGMPVFELDTADSEGDPLGAQGRLSVLNLAQRYCHDPAALLVFDEAEDILSPSPSDRGKANSHKGWFNQMLEKNRQPVFWISNSIETLDPAFSRRFDFILEVPIPPKAQRGRILTKMAGKLVSPGLIEHLAGIEHLSPAVVTRARDVIHAIRRDIPRENRDAALTHVIGGIMKAQGHPDPAKPSIQMVQAGLYDVGHLNTTADLPQIAANLRKTRAPASACMVRPAPARPRSGTGLPAKLASRSFCGKPRIS